MRPIAVRELAAALRLSRIWWHLGVQDMRRRFRRSAIGVGWIFIQLAVSILALGGVYGTLLGQDMRTFLPFLASGLVLWGFITSSILEGGQAFVASEGYIKQIGLPVQLYVFRAFVSVVIGAAISSLSFVVVAAVYRLPVRWGVLWSAPGVLLLVVVGFLLALIFAHLTACFRDTTHLAATALHVAFFVTPVLWPPELLRGRRVQWVVDLNPIHHLLEIVRRPLLASEPAGLVNYAVALGIVAVLAVLGGVVLTTYSRRIVYLL